MKKVILLGAGASMKEPIENGLWDKIKPYEKWSLNSVFKVMPYLPDREIFVDMDFVDANIDELQALHTKGVPLFSRRFTNRKKYAQLEHMGLLTQYETTGIKEKYCGKDAITNNSIFRGQMGLSGTFALHLAIAEKYNEIFMLGYDGGSPSINDKLTHFYQDDIIKHNIYSTGAGRPEVYMPEGHLRSELNEDFSVFCNEIDVQIWNVSPNSNIHCFSKITYDQFYQLLS